jgi:hypothetical protein
MEQANKAVAPKIKKAKRTKAQILRSIVKSKDLGKCEKIIALHRKHLSKKEIVDLGFNKNTVYRQTREAEMA